MLGTRAASDGDFMMFCQHGANAIVVERALHEGFFKAWNLAPLIAAQRDAMRAQFVQTSRFEWMFWERGWQRQGWPV